MELLYAYVGEYSNCISNQEFKFSSRFKVIYEEDIITINKNENYIENFYGYTISDITAVVGKNGSGKTTILDLIGLDQKHRVESSEYIYDTKVYYKDKYFIIYHMYKDIFYIEGLGDFNINNIEKFNHKTNMNRSQDYDWNINEFFSFFIKKDGNKFIIEEDDRRLKNDKDIAQIIYINDLFNRRKKEQVYYQLSTDIKFIKRNNISKINIRDWYGIFIKLCNYKQISSKKMKIVFRKYDYEHYFNSSISIEPIIKEDKPKFLGNSAIIIEENLNDFFRYFNTNIINHIIYINDNLGYKLDIFDFRNFIKEISDEDIYTYHLKIFEYMKSVIFSNHRDKENIDEFCKYNKHSMCNNCVDYNDCLEFDDILDEEDIYTNSHNKYKEYIILLESLFFNLIKIKKYIIPGIDCFELDLDEKYDKDVCKFLKVIEDIKTFVEKNEDENIINPIDIENIRMSKGEKKLIAIFSQILGQIKKIVLNSPAYFKGIVIVVDEIEESMHPEWARNLINIIIQFMDELKIKLSSDMYIYELINIQLILSTHSPFILSDLKKDNIICLEMINENIQKNDIDKIESTFAQNIHTIMNNNFFMNSTIGEYSKIKINEVINMINSKESNENTIHKIEIKKIIDTIGEPVLKSKLEEMYNKKFNINNEDIEILNKMESILKKYNLQNQDRLMYQLKGVRKKIENNGVEEY